MPKRGRPLSTEMSDAAAVRRRELTRARVIRFRQRRQHGVASEEQQMLMHTLIEEPPLEAAIDPSLHELGFRLGTLEVRDTAEELADIYNTVPFDDSPTLYQPQVVEDTSSRPERIRVQATVDSDSDDEDEEQSSEEVRDEHFSLSVRDLPFSPLRAHYASMAQPTIVQSQPPLPDFPSPMQSPSPEPSTFRPPPLFSGGQPLVDYSSDEELGEDLVEAHLVEQELDEDEAYVVEKLFTQLQGFHGCEPQKHEEMLQHHMGMDGEHLPLSSVCTEDFPSVLGNLDCLSPNTVPQTIDAEAWSRMFTGVTGNGDEPPNVCLHEENPPAVSSDIAFDVDSFLGFASSLAFAKEGIEIQPAPLVVQNIQTDNHITYELDREPDEAGPTRRERVMLKDVPHVYFGRLTNHPEITIHILFPHLSHESKFIALTQHQVDRWISRVLLPALKPLQPPHVSQHFPSSYRHAKANSRAYQVEMRSVKTSSYATQRQLSYTCDPDILDELWEGILYQSALLGVQDFREPEIFFCAKGTKLRFKSLKEGSTLNNTLRRFYTYTERIFNLDYIIQERLWVDIGKETCQDARSQASGNVAQTYLWRKCCLESYLSWMYDGELPRTGSSSRWYTIHLLRDTACLTSVPPRNSKHRRGGLIYSQLYASVKEVSDASGNIYPFQHPYIDAITIHKKIFKGLLSYSNGRCLDQDIVMKGYKASKQRANHCLSDCKDKSYGTREEHRVTWAVYMALYYRSATSHVPNTLSTTPTYIWAVDTSIYLDYLWRNVNKFAAGFEVVYAQADGNISWESTKIMSMFLRCLGIVLRGQILQRDSALWWGCRERPNPIPGQIGYRFGLGFMNTLERYGYCWIEPRIDWHRLRFQRLISNSMLFSNVFLRQKYARPTKGFLDLTVLIENGIEWLRFPGWTEELERRLIKWFAHLILRQMRIDVLERVVPKDELERFDPYIRRGLMGFSYPHLLDLLGNPPHIIEGNKTEFKEPLTLVKFLFDFNDKRRRGWDTVPYRVMYMRTYQTLERLPQGIQRVKQLRDITYKTALRFNSILPYPNAATLTQTTKAKQRMWYSIIEENQTYVWGKGRYIKGYALPLPKQAEWTIEQWEELLRRRGVQIPRGDEVNRRPAD